MDSKVAVARIVPADSAARRLFGSFLFAALASLAFGGLAAAGIAVVRAPLFSLSTDPLTYYALLTVHGLSLFYHWFLFFQAALLMLAVGKYIPGARAFSIRLGWVAFGTMALGAAIQLVSGASEGAVLYTAFPPMSGQFSGSPAIYLGFMLLAFGILMHSVNYVATLSLARREGLVGSLPTPTYVGLVWSIVMCAASVIAIGIYTPALLWSLGAMPIDPMAYTMGYFTFFHVNHYVPLIAAVGLWYALAKHTIGAESVFGERFSKAVFTVYPVIVPPTFLYHLFLDPGVPAAVKSVGSILSVFVGVPTIIVSVVVVGMMEARMRAAGAKGAFGWLLRLPWNDPAFAGLSMGMMTFGLGGVFAYALLSEGLASLLHGTFVLPGYFHAFTSAGVTLTFMATVYSVLPAFVGRPLWGLLFARLQPYLMAAGTLSFVVFGVAAGYAGAPRRVAGIAYGGESPPVWGLLMNLTEIVGGLLMAVAGGLFLMVVAGTLLSRRSAQVSEVAKVPEPLSLGLGSKGMTWASAAPAVVVIVLIVLVSVSSFELVRRWPFVIH